MASDERYEQHPYRRIAEDLARNAGGLARSIGRGAVATVLGLPKDMLNLIDHTGGGRGDPYRPPGLPEVEEDPGFFSSEGASAQLADTYPDTFGYQDPKSGPSAREKIAEFVGGMVTPGPEEYGRLASDLAGATAALGAFKFKGGNWVEKSHLLDYSNSPESDAAIDAISGPAREAYAEYLEALGRYYGDSNPDHPLYNLLTPEQLEAAKRRLGKATPDFEGFESSEYGQHFRDIRGWMETVPRRWREKFFGTSQDPLIDVVRSRGSVDLPINLNDPIFGGLEGHENITDWEEFSDTFDDPGHPNYSEMWKTASQLRGENPYHTFNRTPALFENEFDELVDSDSEVFQDNPEYPFVQQNPWLKKLPGEERVYSTGYRGDVDMPSPVRVMLESTYRRIAENLMKDPRVTSREEGYLKNLSFPAAMSRVFDDIEKTKNANRGLADTPVGSSFGPLTKVRQYDDGSSWVDIDGGEPDVVSWEKFTFKDEKGHVHHAERPITKDGTPYVNSKGKKEWVYEGDDTSKRYLEDDIKRDKLRSGLKEEGDKMGHCVGSYCDRVKGRGIKIYSLRDKKGNPHVTVEVKPGDPVSKLGLDSERFFNWYAYHDEDELRDFYNRMVERGEIERLGNEDLLGVRSSVIDYMMDHSELRETDDGNYYVPYEEFARSWRKFNEVIGKPVDEEVLADNIRKMQSYGENRVEQIRGKQNERPDEKYIGRVVDFLNSSQNLGEVRDMPRGVLDLRRLSGGERVGKDGSNTVLGLLWKQTEEMIADDPRFVDYSPSARASLVDEALKPFYTKSSLIDPSHLGIRERFVDEEQFEEAVDNYLWSFLNSKEPPP